MPSKRNPLRLTRAEEEMIRAIRECRRLQWEFCASHEPRYYGVTDVWRRVHYAATLPAALKRAKEAMR